MSKAYMTLKESKDLHSYLKNMIHRDNSRERDSSSNGRVIDITHNGGVKHQQ